MARQNYKNKRAEGGDIVELGNVLHKCEGNIVIKLISSGIPYPGATVFTKNKKCVGKVDEVLGTLDEGYASIALDNKENIDTYKEGECLYASSDRFIQKERFLPRTEVEKKKEKVDKMKYKTKNSNKSRNNNFNKKKFNDKKKPNKKIIFD
ncbi:H/ACA ribonucleoprotein complex subunit GAR1 [Astathelohania contejeani]|uniref:H/ACA ribonucleoprotein complex subunit n=1 Tax=Astathelohania contejeani TaxID=164912 RepID=A0ABQ7HZN2_9MICR|nr:H/ACA ribonucleoprotein complex subunit GAR1 [Thelohania contejeani]